MNIVKIQKEKSFMKKTTNDWLVDKRVKSNRLVNCREVQAFFFLVREFLHVPSW